MTKIAILQVADTGPLESLVVMLRHVGYECLLPSAFLRKEIRSTGADTVLDIDDLVRNMGYERPMRLREANEKEMSRADLYVDIKAHRNYPRIVRRWPNLTGKVLWYRINGGRPEHVIRRDERGNVTEDCGDEVNPPCPILTPNQWYRPTCSTPGVRVEDITAYTCWPPFVRFASHLSPRETSGYSDPICLVHNFVGWGYGALEAPLRKIGVKIFGVGSPDGLLDHVRVPPLLRSALAMVHLKSSDAPGYALYEALASACPVICSRKLIWKNRMEDLLLPGKTCLVFDRPTHDAMTEEDIRESLETITESLYLLRDPQFNREIGEAGRDRLESVLWSAEKDGDSLRDFFRRNFP